MNDSIVPDLTLSALIAAGEDNLARYALSLRHACEAYPPPFGMGWYGEKYRTVASDPQWMAASLVANAEKEAEGSRKLWALAARITDRDVAAQVRCPRMLYVKRDRKNTVYAPPQ